MSLAVSAGAVGTVWGAAGVDFDLQAAIEASQAAAEESYEQELLRAMEASRLAAEAEATPLQELTRPRLALLSAEVREVDLRDVTRMQTLLGNLLVVSSTHTMTDEQEVELAILMSGLEAKIEDAQRLERLRAPRVVGSMAAAAVQGGGSVGAEAVVDSGSQSVADLVARFNRR